MIPDLLRRVAGNAVAGDPYFSSVSLLLHMDGTNGSTSFVDSGPNALAVTASGNAQISTTQSKFGGAAGYFDGNGDSLTAPASSLFAFGTGDFTIEAWLYSLDTGSSQRGIFDTRTTTSGAAIMLRENGNGFLVFINGATSVSTSTGRNPNTWQHVAIVRKGTTLTLYVDGVSVASATNSANLTENSCRISGFTDTQASPYAYYGYIEELEVTKYARHTSNFTPRAKALPNIYNPYKTPPTSGAALWLAGDDSSTLFTDAGVTPVKVNGDLVYRWSDKSGNSRHATQTTSGNRPTWVPPASGRNGLGALAFNGSKWSDFSDYSSLNFGANDFTIEGWIKPSSYTGNSVLLGCGNNGIIVYFTSSGAFGVSHYGVAGLLTSSVISTSSWTHFAISRSGTNLRVFINGSLATTLAGNTSNFTGTNPARIGNDPHPGNGNYGYSGQIQNLLIYKGQALYTANFTPWMS